MRRFMFRVLTLCVLASLALVLVATAAGAQTDPAPGTESSIPFVPLVALGLVVYTLTNFAKYLMNRQWNAAATVILGWAVGSAAVFLFGATDFADTVTVGGQSLADLGGWSKVLVGLVVASGAVAFYDAKRAVDRSDSAQTLPLTGTRRTRDDLAASSHVHSATNVHEVGGVTVHNGPPYPPGAGTE